MRFDGDCLQSLCLKENLTVTNCLFLFRRFIQVKRKSFDASIFNDNPMTKSLAEESIENNQHLFSTINKTKHFYSYFEHFLFENETVERLFFISTHRNRIKKQLTRSFKFPETEKLPNRSENEKKNNRHLKEKIGVD